VRCRDEEMRVGKSLVEREREREKVRMTEEGFGWCVWAGEREECAKRED